MKYTSGVYGTLAAVGKVDTSTLPKLPGNSFEAHDLRDRHHKQQEFGFINGYSMERRSKEVPPQPNTELIERAAQNMADREKYGEFGYPPRGVGYNAEGGEGSSAGAMGNTTTQPETVPGWIALDRQVLRFQAYFKEPVTESRMEHYRVRKVILYYYLEDDTIHVGEPRIENSGLPQGVFLSRCVVPNPLTNQSYNYNDLAIGREVELFGRVYRIFDCDTFTRDFYSKNGIDQGAPEECAQDIYTTQRTLLKETVRTHMRSGEDKMEKFLKNDGKVLRFYVVWDDREALYGDIRNYILHYFLADDTVEVREVHGANSGRDPFPMLMKRTALPKNTLDNKPTDCYSPADFRIGNTVNVFGRHMLIRDCDPFTKRWYKDHFGLVEDDFTPIELPKHEERVPRMPLPPPNGFGSDADSISNFLNIAPKAPKQDFLKAMENEGKILRYVARFANPTPEDQDRRFVISVYLMDDTVGIFEPPVRNSGINGGKFLERQKVRNPRNDLGGYYEPKDFYVGAVMPFYAHQFFILEADEYTLAHMEGRPHVYPLSDIRLIHKHLRDYFASNQIAFYDTFKAVDKDNSGTISIDEFRTIVEKSGIELSEQSLLTLMRRYDKNRDGLIQYQEFVSSLSSEHLPEPLESRDDAVHAIDMETDAFLTDPRRMATLKAIHAKMYPKMSSVNLALGGAGGPDMAIDKEMLKEKLIMCGVFLNSEEWAFTSDYFASGRRKIRFYDLVRTLSKLN